LDRRNQLSKRLFDLSEEILELEAQLENEELTEEERQGLVDKWLEAQGDVTQKLDECAAWIELLECMAEQRPFQSDRMHRLAQGDENRAERVRARLKVYFERHELTKFRTPRFTIALQANGGKRPLLVPNSWEQDATVAPAIFQRQRVELDKDSIRKMVEDF